MRPPLATARSRPVYAGWQLEHTSTETASAVERIWKDAPQDEQRTSTRCVLGCFKSSSLLTARSLSPCLPFFRTTEEPWLFQGARPTGSVSLSRRTTIDDVSPVRPTVQVVGRRMDAEHYRLRDFLTRTAQPYEWHEAGSAEADLLLGRPRPGRRGAAGPRRRRANLHRGDRRDDRGGLGRPAAGEAGALRLRRHRRGACGSRCRRLRRIRRPLDARVRPERARRPGLVRHDDRELLRLPRGDRRCRAGATGRPAGRAASAPSSCSCAASEAAG